MTRRHARRPRLTDQDAADLLRRTIDLRAGLIAAQMRLDPHGAQYRSIDASLDALHALLEGLSGRPIDFRRADLGLLGGQPLQQPGASRFGQGETS
jgi:hypothetical protein